MFKKKREKIVLVGGCFDILHPGHLIFLKKAKKTGDKLVVLLESDENIKKTKGINRPMHSQVERAKALRALRFVDSVVKLPFMDSDEAYDQIVLKIKPDIIALTKGYANAKHHKRSAKLIGAKLKYVTNIIGNYSTTNILTSK